MSFSTRRAFACAICLFASAAAHAFSVGNDAACTHTSIQAAIDAAKALGDTAIHTIIVANNASYTGQALVADGVSLSIEGGFADCSAPSPNAPPTEILGAGNGGFPVLVVQNFSTDPPRVVKLSNLVLAFGGSTDSTGGGMRVQGHVQVELAGVRVRQNQAAQGGGISVFGYDSNHPALLRVGASANRISVIDQNHAPTGAGGGVFVGGNAQALFGRNAVAIAGNQGNSGGGLYVAGSGQAQLNVSTGTVLPPAPGLERNRAVMGGGVFVDNGGFLSVDPGYTIADNQASADGGGIAAYGATAQVYLFATKVHGNRADSDGNTVGCGGGVYADSGAAITMFGDLPAPVCSPTEACSRLDDNDATQGGGICATFGAKVLLLGTQAKGNAAQVGAAVYGYAAERVELDSVLIADSHDRGNFGTVYLGQGSHFFASGLTLAASVGGNSLMQMGGASTASLLYSILYQPGYSVLFKDAASTVTAACVLAHEVFPYAGDVRVGDPAFVNPGLGDYTLQPASPAVDACADIVERELDAHAQPRGVDLLDVPDQDGPYDIGAFELQASSQGVFANGFE